jgi:hypothetical protein
MMVTETMHLQRTKKALERLFEVLAKQHSLPKTAYRLAVARRFTICYYAFMSYLIERMKLDQTTELFSLEDILMGCRYHQLVGHQDERMIIQMGMIYASLACYEVGYESVSDEQLEDIPGLAEILKRYVRLQSIPPVNKVRRNTIKERYDYVV